MARNLLLSFAMLGRFKIPPILFGVALMALANQGCNSTAARCAEAAEYANQCLGELALDPEESCDADEAERILSTSCDDLLNGSDRADGAVCISERLCLTCCSGREESSPPLGQLYYLAREQELITADGSAVGSHPAAGSTGREFSVSETVVDVAAGNLVSARTEVMAVAIKGSSTVDLVGIAIDGSKTVTAPFNVTHVAVGDLDADSTDELVVADGNGGLAACRADGTCNKLNAPAGELADIAVGDVNADGQAEILYAFELPGGGQSVQVMQTNAALDSNTIIGSVMMDQMVIRLAAGDVDGDGAAEIAGIVDGSFFGRDSLVVLKYEGDTFTQMTSRDLGVGDDLLDLDMGDLDADDHYEIAVITDEGDVIHVEEGKDLGETWPSVASAELIALADVDGDSPVGVLKGEHEEVGGPMTVSAVIHVPPYYPGLSAGAARAGFGDGKLDASSQNDSVGTTYGADAAVNIGLGDLFGARIGASIGRSVSAATNTHSSVYAGSRAGVSSNPKYNGWNRSVGVIASCGCFHAYRYAIEDPENLLNTEIADGAEEKDFVVSLPVGSGTRLMGLKRYNKFAEVQNAQAASNPEVARAPYISVPYVVNDPRTYMAPPWDNKAEGRVKLESVVDESDLVFPLAALKSTQVPAIDSGNAGWFVRAGETETNSETTGGDYGINASVNVSIGAGGSVGVKLGRNNSSTHGVSVGTSVGMMGGIPALPEGAPFPAGTAWEDYDYSVTPIMYRQKFESRPGELGHYFVLSYLTQGGTRSPDELAQGQADTQADNWLDDSGDTTDDLEDAN